MKKPSLANEAPYRILMKYGPAIFNGFIKRCHNCAVGPVDEDYSRCPILHTLIRSIADDHTLRWDEEWVELDNKGASCNKFKEVPRDSRG